MILDGSLVRKARRIQVLASWSPDDGRGSIAIRCELYSELGEPGGGTFTFFIDDDEAPAVIEALTEAARECQAFKAGRKSNG